MEYRIINGDCLNELDTLEENSIDSIITDPPYGLTSITKRFGGAESKPAQYGQDGSFARLSKGFMGKEWDGSGIEYNVKMWKKCLRALKPGGYLLAFGGSRTFHRIAVAIEDAGFEIRDTIMWLYGSGFPKSMDIGLQVDKKSGVESPVIGIGKSGGAETHTRCMNSVTQSGKDVFGGEYEIREAQNEWKGWKTALKPSFEPIIVARKPVQGTIIDNIAKYGVGGLNIDECRVGEDVIKGGTMPDFRDVGKKSKEAIGIDKLSFGQVENVARKPLEDHIGRYPSNTILTHEEDFEEVCGGLPEGAYRYFYNAKATRKDRDEGLDSFEIRETGDLQGGRKEGSRGSIMVEASGRIKENPFAGNGAKKRNTHPTVKPTKLMQYLIRLVTPKGGTVLDPFMGSGSTGKACAYENIERNANYKFIGIEKDEEYCKIASARIEYASKKENEIDPQVSLF